MQEAVRQNCVLLGSLAMLKRKEFKTNGITFGVVMIILMSISIVLILTTIKIYLSNEIYYHSKVINKMKREVSILHAEKVMLEQSVEALKFKNRVSDAIFLIDDDLEEAFEEEEE
jgi:cell division protein FtsL